MSKVFRIVLSLLLLAGVSAGVTSCARGCGQPNICSEVKPAYQQLSDEQIETMSSQLSGL
ncbi:hypothetical protein [Martelella mediterranea]|uniref:hypothetical protein n=1 Tax=Martelella mediterranea TaxID=293089 RepID=UPI00104B26A4|nr:hypothetical protein [Martelella mediterranea]